jgi:hypothetical protein
MTRMLPRPDITLSHWSESVMGVIRIVIGVKTNHLRQDLS